MSRSTFSVTYLPKSILVFFVFWDGDLRNGSKVCDSRAGGGRDFFWGSSITITYDYEHEHEDENGRLKPVL